MGRKAFPFWAVALTLSLITAPALATQVYRHVDEHGNVSFSDEPRSDADETVEIQPVQGTSFPQPRERPRPEPTRRSAEAEGPDLYESISINKPEHDSAFWRTSGDVVIEVSSEPGLRPGHRYKLEINGDTRDTTTSSSFTISNMDRGTHEAIVHIVNDNEDVLHSSELTRFTVHRHSVLQ